MPIRPSETLAEVKLAIMEAAGKSSARRLLVLQDKSPCRSGCSACCSRMIFVSLAEALVIHQHLVERGEWESVKAAAALLMPMLENSQPSTWFQMNQACPVLNHESRTCRAYEVRPTPCSAHYVTSKPELCDPWSTTLGHYEAVDFVDIHDEFVTKLAAVVDASGFLTVRLPMPAALIMAEKIQSLPSVSGQDLTEFIRSELA